MFACKSAAYLHFGPPGGNCLKGADEEQIKPPLMDMLKAHADGRYSDAVFHSAKLLDIRKCYVQVRSHLKHCLVLTSAQAVVAVAALSAPVDAMLIDRTSPELSYSLFVNSVAATANAQCSVVAAICTHTAFRLMRSHRYRTLSSASTTRHLRWRPMRRSFSRARIPRRFGPRSTLMCASVGCFGATAARTSVVALAAAQ